MLGTTLCPLLLAMLGRVLASGPDSQSSSVQIIVPEKIEESTSSEEKISYIIPINKKPYIVHLQKSYFLADRFMVYSYNKGSVSSRSAGIPSQCYYQGYVKGYLNSVVTLSTCSGLRGILQFENVSYGIEPLESTITLQHIIYKLGKVEDELTVFNKNSRNIEMPTNYGILINEKPESPLKQSFPLYLEMSIVVDKALYDYLGSDSMIVTNKIIEIISLINSVFSQLKVTIVLSSLELWSDKNRIPTVGEADELLRQFLEWKQSYLTLRPHDVAYLFIYNEYPNYVGATYPGKMCTAGYSAGITMYPKDMTLEAFSVVVTQMLGLSLGISYDDPTKCHCSEATCIMNPRAMQSTGMKVFSNCSLNDFEHFKSNVGAKCLQNKPQMQTQPQAVCGNGKVEGDESCDCGSVQQCGPESCCEPTTCVLKPGKHCDSDSPSQTCCQSCEFLPAEHVCRPPKHTKCDIPEVCNGSSGLCPSDLKVLDGLVCRDGGSICYNGDCPDMNKRCETIYGKGSRNAPFSCYEEIQSQTDRFGNCGKDNQNRYIFCGWRNLICGRLICTYPSPTPYNPPNNSTASVIYAFVRNKVCISVDYGSNVKDDPLKVISGSICDQDRVCNSLSQCHCMDCNTKSRSALWPHSKDLNMQGLPKKTEKWFLSLYIALILLTSTLLVAAVWKGLKRWLFKEEEFLSSETKSEGNTHTYSKSASEYSTQPQTIRSKSQTSSATPANSY
ncbi:disintegrin and metalloproteinase domain-containing protein 32 isoform X2 [Mesocricetus auratus]|uniref:Disintegrin and metalloproteinase domain-containing protein 32 isoform X2 n=1 Tax=Mesocricetus auratus TaxID=10036 RepID=A0ABM2WA64_MESAU|nr:disintegrin and metalloproteinase domain-containing protein 32 isoform X2 [Mesocricetus auratus]